MKEFLLCNILDAIISQVMDLLKERNLQLFHEIPREIKTLSVYGDQIRLQLVLSDFLLHVVHHAPVPNGWVEIKILPGLKLIKNGDEFIRLQFRYLHCISNYLNCRFMSLGFYVQYMGLRSHVTKYKSVRCSSPRGHII